MALLYWIKLFPPTCELWCRTSFLQPASIWKQWSHYRIPKNAGGHQLSLCNSLCHWGPRRSYWLWLKINVARRCSGWGKSFLGWWYLWYCRDEFGQEPAYRVQGPIRWNISFLLQQILLKNKHQFDLKLQTKFSKINCQFSFSNKKTNNIENQQQEPFFVPW